MKKLSYLLGLVAMVVMMAMTSCSKVSDEVQKVCDVLDDATVAVENAETVSEVVKVMQDIAKNDTEINEETELTEDDKEALKTSFLSLIKASTYKYAELSGEDVPESVLKERFKKIEEQLDEELADCKTLGDFGRIME